MRPEIKIAKSAGFCFGVERAVNMVLEEVKNDRPVCTLGPIIHNRQLVDELSGRGVAIINEPRENTQRRSVVIRSHGVGPGVYRELEALDMQVIDATCPFVAKIQRLAEQAPPDALVLIAGDASHPEVRGIVGYCACDYLVVSSEEELRLALPKITQHPGKIIFFAQTTFSHDEWQKCIGTIKKECTKAKIFDTICNATALRQKEAEELSKDCDLMVVIGGRHSSNTAKLADICRRNCRTVAIETSAEWTGSFSKMSGLLA
jgi:4-hydroxy-3-methylbut-2-enyl diphosphate reductase